jgi:hypothetical protein
MGRGGRREVKIGLVLVPTLSSAIFGRVFSFDHGQFGARRDADIGMGPKAPPLEKKQVPSYAPVNVVVASPDSHALRIVTD